jgi:hypothetical protein
MESEKSQMNELTNKQAEQHKIQTNNREILQSEAIKQKELQRKRNRIKDNNRRKELEEKELAIQHTLKNIKNKNKRVILDSSSDDESQATQTQPKQTTQTSTEKTKLRGRPKFNINSEKNIEHHNLVSIIGKKAKDSERNIDYELTQVNKSTASNQHPQQQHEHQHKKARGVPSRITDWLVRDSTIFKT